MKMKNKTYDTLKWVAQIGLPATATLYFALAQVWSLPLAQEIVGTIVAIDTFLGALLGIATEKTVNSEKNGDSEKKDA